MIKIDAVSYEGNDLKVGQEFKGEMVVSMELNELETDIVVYMNGATEYHFYIDLKAVTDLTLDSDIKDNVDAMEDIISGLMWLEEATYNAGNETLADKLSGDRGNLNDIVESYWDMEG